MNKWLNLANENIENCTEHKEMFNTFLFKVLFGTKEVIYYDHSCLL